MSIGTNKNAGLTRMAGARASLAAQANRRFALRATGVCLLSALLRPSPATAGLFSPPDWPELKAQIRRDYPQVTQMTIDELRQVQQAGAEPVLLDARSSEEFEISHLRGARRASDLQTALSVLAEVPKDRSIVVYCSVGVRSAALARDLQKNGYARVANLEGSLFEWANRGLPLYRGERVVTVVHPFNRKWGQLLKPKLHARP